VYRNLAEIFHFLLLMLLPPYVFCFFIALFLFFFIDRVIFLLLMIAIPKLLLDFETCVHFLLLSMSICTSFVAF